MPGRPAIDRPTRLEVCLPESVRARLDLFLFSELDGRVPKGKYVQFFIERVQEFFDWKRLDLTPYGFPPGFFVAGPKPMLDALAQRLKEIQGATGNSE